MNYNINEIFYSIQCEGYWSGRAAIFIRMAGCNLNCDFCDTNHATTSILSERDIIDIIEEYKSKFVVITGGEPTLQDLTPLVNKLHDSGYYIAIETNGTNEIDYDIDWITCSPKNGAKINLKHMDECKVVLVNGIDLRGILALDKGIKKYIQPCSWENTDECVEFVKRYPEWRLSLQCQKILNIA